MSARTFFNKMLGLGASKAAQVPAQIHARPLAQTANRAAQAAVPQQRQLPPGFAPQSQRPIAQQANALSRGPGNGMAPRGTLPMAQMQGHSYATARDGLDMARTNGGFAAVQNRPPASIAKPPVQQHASLNLQEQRIMEWMRHVPTGSTPAGPRNAQAATPAHSHAPMLQPGLLHSRPATYNPDQRLARDPRSLARQATPMTAPNLPLFPPGRAKQPQASNHLATLKAARLKEAESAEQAKQLAKSTPLSSSQLRRLELQQARDLSTRNGWNARYGERETEIGADELTSFWRPHQSASSANSVSGDSTRTSGPLTPDHDNTSVADFEQHLPFGSVSLSKKTTAAATPPASEGGSSLSRQSSFGTPSTASDDDAWSTMDEFDRYQPFGSVMPATTASSSPVLQARDAGGSKPAALPDDDAEHFPSIDDMERHSAGHPQAPQRAAEDEPSLKEMAQFNAPHFDFKKRP